MTATVLQNCCVTVVQDLVNNFYVNGNVPFNLIEVYIIKTSFIFGEHSHFLILFANASEIKRKFMHVLKTV